MQRTATTPATGVGFDPRIIAAAGAAAISLTAIFTKLADAGVATIVFYRCLIAVVPLALLAWMEIRRRGMPTRRVMGLQALGGVFLGLDFALWTQSISMVGAGVATILNNVQVLVVPMLAWLFYRDRIPMRFVVAVPVMFVGIALASGAVGGEPTGATNPMLGTLLGLASGVAFAGYIIIIGRTGTQSGPNTQVFISTAMAGIVGTVGGGMLGGGGVDLTPGWTAIGWLAALALSGQVLGWVLLGAALPRLSSQVGASMLLLQPALAVVFAMVLIAERPTPFQLVGCLVVIAAVGVVAFEPKSAAGRSGVADGAPEGALAGAAVEATDMDGAIPVVVAARGVVPESAAQEGMLRDSTPAAEPVLVGPGSLTEATSTGGAAAGEDGLTGSGANADRALVAQWRRIRRRRPGVLRAGTRAHAIEELVMIDQPAAESAPEHAR